MSRAPPVVWPGRNTLKLVGVNLHGYALFKYKADGLELQLIQGPVEGEDQWRAWLVRGANVAHPTSYSYQGVGATSEAAAFSVDAEVLADYAKVQELWREVLPRTATKEEP